MNDESWELKPIYTEVQMKTNKFSFKLEELHLKGAVT